MQSECKKKTKKKILHYLLLLPSSVTRKKLPLVYKSCLKMISLENYIDFNTFTKIA